MENNSKWQKFLPSHWGDGSSARILSHDQAEVKHTYTRKGNYVVHMNGTVHGFAFVEHKDDIGNVHPHPCCAQLIDISQWGCVRLANKGKQFFGCGNFNASAQDVLDLTGVTNMYRMFLHASSFNGDVSQWNTGSVTRMGSMFDSASSFNGNISGWNMIALTHDRARIYRDSARG